MPNIMITDNTDHTKSIEIFTGTIWETRLLQSLLSDAGVESFVKDSSLGTFLMDPVKAANCKVIVMEKDSNLAIRITEEFIKNQFSEQHGPDTGESNQNE
jgi:hypothetical protein